MKVSVQSICNVIASKDQTDADPFPLGLLDHIRFGLCYHVPFDETFLIVILSECTNDVRNLIVEGVWRADQISSVSHSMDRIAFLTEWYKTLEMCVLPGPSGLPVT